MSLLLEIPDMFSGIFTTVWVFVVVIIVISLVSMVCIIGLIIFLVRKTMKKSGQIIDQQMEIQEKALEEKECEFCGGMLKGTDRECPNCSAPVQYS
ncbi:MAG: hypothetical protein ACTSR1_03585, partial [Candidatus Heimdallarchaeota archaeon]